MYKRCLSYRMSFVVDPSPAVVGNWLFMCGWIRQYWSLRLSTCSTSGKVEWCFITSTAADSAALRSHSLVFIKIGQQWGTRLSALTPGKALCVCTGAQKYFQVNLGRKTKGIFYVHHIFSVILSSEPFKARWSLYVPPGLTFYVLPTQCVYVFCVDLRTNSDYFPIQH
jgi:hypothetical protein